MRTCLIPLSTSNSSYESSPTTGLISSQTSRPILSSLTTGGYYFQTRGQSSQTTGLISSQSSAYSRWVDVPDVPKVHVTKGKVHATQG